jgi:hypothetical protein
MGESMSDTNATNDGYAAGHDSDAETLVVANWVTTVILVIFFGAGSLFGYFHMNAESYRDNRVYSVDATELSAMRQKEQLHLAGTPVQANGKAVPVGEAMAKIVQEGMSK